MVETILFFVSMLLFGVILVLLPQMWKLGTLDRRMKAFFPMGVVTILWIVLNAVTMVINPVYFAFVYSAKVIFVTLMVYFSIWFFLNFTESKLTNFRLVKALFIVIPVLDILANVTNPLYWLYFVAYDYPIANKGPIFYVHIFLIIVAILFSIAIISIYVVKNSRQYPLLFLTAVGVVTPFILNMLFSFNLVKFEQDLSPIGYVFTIIAFLYFANVTLIDTTKKLSLALAEISKAPALSLGIIEDAAKIIVKEGCYALGTNSIRLGIWNIAKDTAVVKNITYYDMSIGKYTVLDDFDLSGCHEYLQLLKSERVIPVNDTRLPNPLTPWLDSYGHSICALLDAPIRVDGKLVGLISFEQERCKDFPVKREWTTEEQNFISSLSDFMTITISNSERRAIMKRTENAYAMAESALEAKNLFVANMNHEMRTPMNVIVGLTDLLLEEEGIRANVKETLHKINTAGNTLMGLISDVLDISKIDAGKMELMPVQYDVASFLNDIVTLNVIRIEDKPIVFSLDIGENLPRTLHGDDLRVKQILNNLLSNAFKYTKAGSITLSVDCERDGDIVWASFRVTDTGIGIRSQDIGKLFTDYHQVDAKANRRIVGTGLGLSITKRFVELMGGYINVESEYGKGTTFSVRIKQEYVSDETIGKENAESLRAFRYLDKKAQAHKKFLRADLSYARALVVDDFPTNLDVAAGMLRKYKMQVDCVTNGQESIDIIAAGAPIYSVIFMDHMMPEMDGIEAAQAIRALGGEYAKNIPIIALTANAVAGNEKMFLENGFNAYLPKPFNVMTMDSVIQRFVRDKSKE